MFDVKVFWSFGCQIYHFNIIAFLIRMLLAGLDMGLVGPSRSFLLAILGLSQLGLGL